MDILNYLKKQYQLYLFRKATSDLRLSAILLNRELKESISKRSYIEITQKEIALVKDLQQDTISYLEKYKETIPYYLRNKSTDLVEWFYVKLKEIDVKCLDDIRKVMDLTYNLFTKYIRDGSLPSPFSGITPVQLLLVIAVSYLIFKFIRVSGLMPF